MPERDQFQNIRIDRWQENFTRAKDNLRSLSLKIALPASSLALAIAAACSGQDGETTPTAVLFKTPTVNLEPTATQTIKPTEIPIIVPKKTPTPEPTAIPIPETKPELAPPQSAGECTFYTVQEQDTLWGIAEKFYGDGSKYTLIAARNNIANSRVIHDGQEFCIPSADYLPPSVPKPTTQPEPQPTSQPTPQPEPTPQFEVCNTGKFTNLVDGQTVSFYTDVKAQLGHEGNFDQGCELPGNVGVNAVLIDTYGHDYSWALYCGYTYPVSQPDWECFRNGVIIADITGARWKMELEIGDQIVQSISVIKG